MPLQCPHCQSTIVIEGKPPRDVVCPSCGSSIQLDPAATTGWLPEEAPKRLGKFEFLEQLGVGSFGTVYKARDTELDRLVALKVPRVGSIPKAADMDRFLREAKSAAQLKHPGIVALYDAGVIDGTGCLVSEFIPGTTLAQRLSAKRYSLRQAAELLSEVADALHYAHQHGVIHRDIKPSNIMLDLEGRPHLMDFGLAKRAADEITLTLEGQVLGTPAYMSPEQAKGEVRRVDARSDLYSLGVILYELLTGELPFRGQTRMLLVQVIQDEPRPPRRLNDQIPRDLETICLKAMAKEPHRRYLTAADLGTDLGRWLKGEPISARPVTRLERAWRWCRRNPALAMASSSAVLALLATIVVSIILAVYHSRAAVGLRDEQQRTLAALTKAEEQTKLAEQRTREAEDQRRLVGVRLAEAYLVRAIALCEQDDVCRGMLWLARTLELTPDGAADLSRVIRLNLESWHSKLYPLRAVLEHQGPVWSVAYSPDGKTVLTGSADTTARFWDTASGKPLGKIIRHESQVMAVAFNPDGRTVLTGLGNWPDTGIGGAQIWDTAMLRPLLAPPVVHQGFVRAVAFSPDGSRILTGSADGTARLWEAATGKPIGPPLRHQGWVWAVAYSPDGKTVLTGGQDATARLWDAVTGKAMGAPLQHQGPLRAVAYSPDGKTVLTGSLDKTARVWDAATGKPVGSPLQHLRQVVSVCFSPDGSRLLTGEYDNAARVWDAVTRKPIGPSLEHQLSVGAVAFSPDGSRILTGSHDTTARLWGAALPKPIRKPIRHTPHVRAVAFSPDGRTVLTGGSDGRARLWDAATGQPSGPPLPHEGPVSAVAFSANGKMVVTGSFDKTARLWDVLTLKPIGQPLGHEDRVHAVDFSPDGSRILTGSWDQTARLWDAVTCKPIGEPLRHPARVHPSNVHAVAFSPDGSRIVTGSHDFTAQLWDASVLKPIGGPLQHQNQVMAVAYSPDGKTVVTGSMDNTARLWEAATGRPIGLPLQHQAWVQAVAFSPDSRTVVTASDDKTVRLWDRATQKPIGPPHQHQASVLAVAFSPDGKTVVTGGADGTALFWAVPAPVEGALERIRLWVEVTTGMELDTAGAVRVLGAKEWHERQRRLDELGGAPVP